jgi:arylsulfatase A-like enzyme
VTLTERLARAGYRTGAVTDAGFVSRQYGFDQGFEWFLEHPETREQRLAWTLDAAREFLARDDGRPVFLFVHTYRTHWPYRTGSDEDHHAHDELVARFQAELEPGKPPDPAKLDAFARALVALYRRGASELDALVGPWFDGLERAGWLRHGCFVFTSDHGEAFFEHGKSEHGGPPFEEELRVPLFLLGSGIEPRVSSANASLLDLTPTLAELAGIPADPAWCGRSLFRPEVERTTFAWYGEKERRTLAILSGRRKVFVTPEEGALARGEARRLRPAADPPSARTPSSTARPGRRSRARGRAVNRRRSAAPAAGGR